MIITTVADDGKTTDKNHVGAPSICPHMPPYTERTPRGGPLESDESPTWLVADPSSPAANGLEHTRARAWEIEGQSELASEFGLCLAANSSQA